MRHRVYGKHLSRSKNERTALFRSLVRELFLNESIHTTAPKAKAIKGLVDTLIVRGKKKDVSSFQILTSFLVKPELVKKVMEEIAPRYSDRPSGFTNSVRLGARLGDGAMMVRMSLVGETPKAPAKKAVEEAPVKKAPRVRKAVVANAKK